MLFANFSNSALYNLWIEVILNNLQGSHYSLKSGNLGIFEILARKDREKSGNFRIGQGKIWAELKKNCASHDDLKSRIHKTISIVKVPW